MAALKIGNDRYSWFSVKSIKIDLPSLSMTMMADGIRLARMDLDLYEKSNQVPMKAILDQISCFGLAFDSFLPY